MKWQLAYWKTAGLEIATQTLNAKKKQQTLKPINAENKRTLKPSFLQWALSLVDFLNVTAYYFKILQHSSLCD